MSYQPESLWSRLWADIHKFMNTWVGYRQITGVELTRVRTVSSDPEDPDERLLHRLRGAALVPGDNVVTIRDATGRHVVIGAYATENDPQAESISEFGGDGEATSAARSDHEHQGPGAGSLELGTGSVAILRGHAIGYNSDSADAGLAVGYGADAGFISVALGYGAAALGQGAVAVGYSTNAPGEYSLALGRDAEATAIRTIAAGYLALASADYGIAIGFQASASGVQSMALGYQAAASGIRAWALGYAASNGTIDTGKVNANDTYFERSNGAGATRLVLRTSTSVWKVLSVNDNDGIVIGSRDYGTITGLLKANKSVSSGTAVSLRVGPGNTHAAIRALSSGSVYDTGIRIATDETWAHVFIHGTGWGYFPANRLI